MPAMLGMCCFGEDARKFASVEAICKVLPELALDDAALRGDFGGDLRAAKTPLLLGNMTLGTWYT